MKSFSLIGGILLSALIFQGCDESLSSSIPDVRFRIQCDMRQAAYSSLNSPGQFITIEKNNHGVTVGYAGLIVGQSTFPGFNNETVYYAFDRACPVEAKTNVILSIPTDKVGKAVCPQCGTEYDLNNGGIPNGKGKEYLKRYSVAVNSDIITISN